MNETIGAAYDDIPYPSHALTQTHPDRLATLAILFGLESTGVECCRVLELGCGDGGNLIPMAFGLPRSEFVGLDLAPVPIAKGEAIIQALSLSNIRLHAMDLLDLTTSLGRFDYIICHGLYSWVPPVVQDKVLEICGDNLSPNGVAYVSYNALPGCHIRRMVREMLLFHVRNVADRRQQIVQAIAFAKFLIDGQVVDDLFAKVLKEELEHILEKRDAQHLLFHDDLAEFNSPLYFHQFVAHAARHGLQFLAEADFFEMQDFIYPAHVAEQLRAMREVQVVLKEQYLDFLKCRRFRQTLMCHRAHALDRQPKAERLHRLAIVSACRPVSSTPDLHAGVVEEFHGPRGAAVKTDFSLAKAALVHLGEVWPRAVPFPELFEKAQERLGQDSSKDDAAALTLAETLLRIHATGALELSAHVPSFLLEASARPVVSSLARWHVQNGARFVPTLRHTNVEVEDSVARSLLLLLDGTRNRSDLLREFASQVRAGELVLQRDGQPIDNEAEALAFLANGLEQNLAKLARIALLAG